MHAVCNNRAGALGYYPVGMDEIKWETSKQFLNGQGLKQEKKGNECIPVRLLPEICQNTTTIGEAFPAREKIPVTGNPHAIEGCFGIGTLRVGGQDMDLEVFSQPATQFQHKRRFGIPSPAWKSRCEHQYS